MSGRLTGVYQLPGGGFPPRDSKLWVRVPTDREEGGKTVYAAPIMVPINPPTHPTAPGFYDSGLLGEGPYQIQKAIFGAKDYRSRWYDVVLTAGSHTVQELIEDYDPDLYTPPVVNAVAVLRDETRTARDEAAQILEDVEAGAVPDSAVASKITAADTATRAAVDARITAVGNTAYAPASVAADVAGKLDQSTADGRYAPTVDARVPASNLPALFRTTDSQPFTADSIWNTPIGQGATFEAAGSAATANFLAATPAINDTLNGYGFYNNIARPSDPMCTGSYTPSGGSAITFTHRIPYDPVISTGSDASMRVIDGRFAYDYWKTVKVNEYTYTADFITRTDLLGTGRNAGTRAARFPTAGGLIRSHELAKCYIPHALCISIPPTSLKRGFVWPAADEDAPSVTYSGEVPMGSFFAIPPSVNIASLSLSQEGYALAECLQNYGMYVGDASGSAAISVDGEAAVVARPALERMRTDWTTLFAQLRRVTNVGTVAGAPGQRRVPAAGPVAIRADYQETVIDVLTARLRATSGAILTSENCAVDVDPIVSTNAANGGRSLTWTGWPAQYRINGGAIKRIAAPDGQTRILLINPGNRNVRLGFMVQAMHASGFAYAVVATSDSSNHYRVAITSGGSMHLQRNVGAVTTALSPALPNGTIGVNKYVELMVYGPSISVLVDGDVVAEVVDTSNLQGTQCGIYLPSDTSIAWKSLSVRSVPRLFRKPRVES
ncbi:minor tail protein [Gordonia phage Horus]|uniref:Minor tail protein n=1 Tax=Gordonia phage Horus TaxID=2301696 RepID=A0A385DYY8_9CAUD|nr:minor tail protein [Gordonia phage Horus]AXQ63887.1 minor tail protein [Gordonia phage Horus]QYC53701.1 minor tail protein [Gordonia phage Leroy]UTN91491.1 minor tail protein [Gordonia phage Periwinkle]